MQPISRNVGKHPVETKLSEKSGSMAENRLHQLAIAVGRRAPP
jgi:hypothetical protein